MRKALKKKRNKFWLLTMTLILTGCSSDEKFKNKVMNVIKENPEIVLQTIEKYPTDFVLAFQSALKTSREELDKKRNLEKINKIEAAMNNPLKARIRDDEAIRGPKDAQITLIEYSDFECPYCTQGYKTVNLLKKRYGKNLRVIYKHLPLSFHKSAKLSAQYYEALRLQSHDLAFNFHDKIFENQSKLKQGETFLIKLSKKLGANMKKLKKDLNSKEVMDRINDDIKEAQKFGFKGTPGFIINGVPVSGAYPEKYFVNIINTMKKKNRIGQIKK